MSQVHNKEWDRAIMVGLLSEKRLSTYLAATDGVLDTAFELYAWNTQLAGAMLSATAMVEVVVRNSIDRTLTAWNATRQGCDDWFALPALDSRAREDVAKARVRVERNGSTPNHDKIVAELSFGFWRFLTSRKYHASIWVPALHKAFSFGDSDLRKRQRETARLLGNMNFLRNRAAHLEPIFRRNIARDIAEARCLMRWVDPEALLWFDDTLRLDDVLTAKPTVKPRLIN